MSPHRIFESEYLVVEAFFQEKRSHTLAVTFTERTNRTLEGKGFGGETLFKMGVDVIAVKQTKDDWYGGFWGLAGPAISEFLGSCANSYAIRFGYGSSMGAYAAMKFAKPMGLSRVLALSPLFDITFDWERRWLADRPLTQAPMFAEGDVSPDCEYVVAYDPHDQDSRHVDNFVSTIGRHTVLLQVPYAGHPTGAMLNQCGELRPLLERVAFEKSPLSSMVIRPASRHDSSIYLGRLAERCLHRRKWRHAENLVRKAILVKPTDAEAHRQLCRALWGLGCVAEALDAGEKAKAMSPGHKHFSDYLDLLKEKSKQA